MMKPTAKLRFVEREERIKYPDGDTYMIKNVRVLQQWWISESFGTWVTATEYRPDGEWRDVPLETENA